MEITIDEDGVLSDWRDGVFDEGLKEVLEMQKALNRKEQK
jgi:predicted ATPase